MANEGTTGEVAVVGDRFKEEAPLTARTPAVPGSKEANAVFAYSVVLEFSQSISMVELPAEHARAMASGLIAAAEKAEELEAKPEPSLIIRPN